MNKLQKKDLLVTVLSNLSPKLDVSPKHSFAFMVKNFSYIEFITEYLFGFKN